jgi:hypothetical protein
MQAPSTSSRASPAQFAHRHMVLISAAVIALVMGVVIGRWQIAGHSSSTARTLSSAGAAANAASTGLVDSNLQPPARGGMEEAIDAAAMVAAVPAPLTGQPVTGITAPVEVAANSVPTESGALQFANGVTDPTDTAASSSTASSGTLTVYIVASVYEATLENQAIAWANLARANDGQQPLNATAVVAPADQDAQAWVATLYDQPFAIVDLRQVDGPVPNPVVCSIPECPPAEGQ